jgi:hypothetical protein
MIALIVVFGLISLIATVFTWYVCIRAIRRKSALAAHRTAEKMAEERDSLSNIPMMSALARDEAARSEGEKSPTSAGQEQWQTVSADQSMPLQLRDQNEEERETLTSSEVWRIANAFRSALRRPVFGTNRSSLLAGAQHRSSNDGERQEDDDMPCNSPLTRDEDKSDEEAATASQRAAHALLREDLEGEGQQLRDVTERKRPLLHIS